MSLTLSQSRKSIRRTMPRFIGRYPIAMALALFLYNAFWRLKLVLGRSDTEINGFDSQLNPADACDYIEDVFSSYKRFSGITGFTGTTAELGPGGNAGVALLMRKDGCERVELVDRFRIRSDPKTQEKIYSELSRRYDLDDLRIGPTWNPRRLSGISWREGEGAEAYFRQCARLDPSIYSFIGSHTVLQHLYRP